MTKKNRVLRISFRLKIITLVIGVLVASFASYLSLGTGLIIRDKSSYIYDFNLGLVDRVSESISVQISNLSTLAHVLGSALELKTSSESTAKSVDQAFALAFSDKVKTILPDSGLLILHAKNREEFEPYLSFPPENPILQKSFASFRWRPIDFEKRTTLIGRPDNGILPIAIRMRDVDGNPSVAFSNLKIGLDFVQRYSEQTWIEVLGPGGMRIEDNRRQNGPNSAASMRLSSVAEDELATFEKSIVQETFISGGRDIRIGEEDFLASYERVPGIEMTVLGLTPKRVAFAAAQALKMRSLLLGLAILSIGVLIALIFAKQVTSRLRVLWNATRKLGEGHLKTRISDPNTGFEDELADVSCSFNAMADRIEALVQEAAEKARMKSELETAQTVQSRFLPTNGYRGPKVRLFGSSIPATECAGDWWQYREIGPYLVVAIGDVTGHGVSSALVTAAAHGTFSVVMEEFHQEFETERKKPELSRLVQKLSQAIHATGGEHATMTGIISLIDTQKGIISTVNASHPNPFLYRPRVDAKEGDFMRGIHLLNQAKVEPLGMKLQTASCPQDTFLEPGDIVLLYTDGLLECVNDLGVPMKKKALFQKLADLQESTYQESTDKDPCSALMNQFKAFLGSKAASPDDDITAVIIEVPRKSVDPGQMKPSEAA